MQEALRLLADRDHLSGLKKKDLQKVIGQGLASLERGEGLDGEDFFEDLEREEAVLAGASREA